MLFYMYQVFSSLQGHLHFLGHFSFTFMEYFFLGRAISFKKQQVVAAIFSGRRGRLWQMLAQWYTIRRKTLINPTELWDCLAPFFLNGHWLSFMKAIGRIKWHLAQVHHKEAPSLLSFTLSMWMTFQMRYKTTAIPRSLQMTRHYTPLHIRINMQHKNFRKGWTCSRVGAGDGG